MNSKFLFFEKTKFDQLSARRVGKDSLLLCSSMSGLVLFIVRFNPAILDRVGKVSDKTKKQRMLFFVPSLLLLLGIPLRSNLLLKKQNKGELNFLSAFLNAYAVNLVVNLFDLLIMDYLLLIHLQPTFIKPAITNLDPIYLRYSFHFKAFMKGLILTMLTSLILAALSSGGKKDTKNHETPG